MSKEQQKATSETSRTHWLQKASWWATIAAAIGAGFFGYYQNSINHQLLEMNRVVAVTANIEGRGTIRLRNVGKVNLYMQGFRDSSGGSDRVFIRRQLLAVTSQGDPGLAVRGIEVPNNADPGYLKILTFFWQDEHGRKWVSEHGVRVEQKTGSTSRCNQFSASLCSYDTRREDWEQSRDGSANLDINDLYIKGARFVRPHYEPLQ